MPFTIYGGYLRPGHCEVHPEVHEEYPCSECLREDYENREQERAYERYCEDELAKQYQEHLENEYAKYILWVHTDRIAEIFESLEDSR
jgi:hypothetical protein